MGRSGGVAPQGGQRNNIFLSGSSDGSNRGGGVAGGGGGRQVASGVNSISGNYRNQSTGVESCIGVCVGQLGVVVWSVGVCVVVYPRLRIRDFKESAQTLGFRIRGVVMTLYALLSHRPLMRLVSVIGGSL